MSKRSELKDVIEKLTGDRKRDSGFIICFHCVVCGENIGRPVRTYTCDAASKVDRIEDGLEERRSSCALCSNCYTMSKNKVKLEHRNALSLILLYIPATAASADTTERVILD